MTSKDYAVLEVENESDDLGVDLQFQDFGQIPTQSLDEAGSHGQSGDFASFPHDSMDEQKKKLLDESDEEEITKSPSFWTFAFYQQFFDVDSRQVGDRIIWSMVPKPGTSYLQSYIRPNPDLYGPFWICMTLVFTTAITGNLSNYLQTPPEDVYVWKYDFHKVTYAASAIFAYAWLVPLALAGVLWWRGSRANITLLELLCLYGYSLAIFIPVSILWMIPQPWLRWCLAIVAPVLSGTVLVRTLWPGLSYDTKQIAVVLAVAIMVLHATLALGFMLYFFTPPPASTHLAHQETLPINVNQSVSPTVNQTENRKDTGQGTEVEDTLENTMQQHIKEQDNEHIKQNKDSEHVKQNISKLKSNRSQNLHSEVNASKSGGSVQGHKEEANPNDISN